MLMRKTILILSYIANVITAFVFLGANWYGEKSIAFNRCCALINRPLKTIQLG